MSIVYCKERHIPSPAAAKFEENQGGPGPNFLTMWFDDGFDYSECMEKFYTIPDFDEYYQDFHDSMRTSEQRLLKHNMRSPQLESRIKLVELAKTICAERFLSRTTLHLSIYILDRFMDVFEITSERLGMFTGVCVLIAAKMEDRNDCIPRFADLQLYWDKKIDPREYAILECMILNSLRWKMIVPTAASFLEYYILASITVQDVPTRLMGVVPVLRRCEDGLKSNDQLQEFSGLRLTMYNLIYYLLDLSLNEVLIIGVLPSKLASAAILCARQILGHRPNWTSELALITGYKVPDLSLIANELNRLYDDNSNGSGKRAAKPDLEEVVLKRPRL